MRSHWPLMGSNRWQKQKTQLQILVQEHTALRAKLMSTIISVYILITTISLLHLQVVVVGQNTSLCHMGKYSFRGHWSQTIQCKFLHFINESTMRPARLHILVTSSPCSNLYKADEILRILPNMQILPHFRHNV